MAPCAGLCPRVYGTIAGAVRTFACQLLFPPCDVEKQACRPGDGDHDVVKECGLLFATTVAMVQHLPSCGVRPKNRVH